MSHTVLAENEDENEDENESDTKSNMDVFVEKNIVYTLNVSVQFRMTLPHKYWYHGMAYVPKYSHVHSIVDEVDNDTCVREIILFCCSDFKNEFNFINSLQWLKLLKNDTNDTYSIHIDSSKTELFQKFINNTIGDSILHSFGYVVIQSYFIMFGGLSRFKTPIDNIFFFDFDQMKWFESDIVK